MDEQWISTEGQPENIITSTATQRKIDGFPPEGSACLTGPSGCF
jgi:hypothetical protein